MGQVKKLQMHKYTKEKGRMNDKKKQKDTIESSHEPVKGKKKVPKSPFVALGNKAKLERRGTQIQTTLIKDVLD